MWGCSSPGLSSDLSRKLLPFSKVLPGVRAQTDHLHGACQGPSPAPRPPTPVLQASCVAQQVQSWGTRLSIHNLRC